MHVCPHGGRPGVLRRRARPSFARCPGGGSGDRPAVPAEDYCGGRVRPHVSPLKSVSALWAIAPAEVAARIERAHQGAVADALRFIETQALYTRTGTNGVRQVDVTGLVATAFTHRDSRAGDPDLHTHVAIAKKVQTAAAHPVAALP